MEVKTKKTFVLADESINSHGFYMLMGGCDSEQFKKNPVMLWMHSRAWRGTTDEVLPIGRWENIRIEKGKLLADAVFDENDEFAMRIADKVENNFIKMASVGITVLAISEEPKYLKPGQTRSTVTKWKPREASIVDMGANDNAMALAFYDENGDPLNMSQDGSQEIPVKLLSVTNTNQTENEMELKVAMITLLGLAAAATDEQLSAKVKEVLDQNKQLAADKEAAEKKLKELNDKMAESRKVEATSLVDAAIKDGRLNADSKPQWEKLFETNFDTAKATLLSIPVRKSAKEQLEGGGEKNLTERAKFEKMSWAEMDKAGVLKAVREKHYDLYEEKFEEKFGRKPSKK